MVHIPIYIYIISPKGGNGVYTRITVEIFRRVGFHRRTTEQQMYCTILYKRTGVGFDSDHGIFFFRFFVGGVGGGKYNNNDTEHIISQYG